MNAKRKGLGDLDDRKMPAGASPFDQYRSAPEPPAEEVPYKQRMDRLTVYVPPPLMAEVDRLREQSGLSRTQLVVNLLVGWVAAEE